MRKKPPGTGLWAIKAMLLGAAGLLAHVRPPEEARSLRTLRRHLLKTKAMAAGQWSLFRVRPANHPAVRVLGAAHLVHRYLDSGLVDGLGEEVEFGDAGSLLSRLTVRPFIGKGRAGDMAVNVVLPFLHAYAGIKRKTPLAEACIRLYHTFPRLQENEITQEMRRVLGWDGGAARRINARRQQGLLHLYRSLVSA